MSQLKGKFVTIEGVEGAGKSTVIETLAGHLDRAEIPFIQTREPGGTELGEAIRELLLNSNYSPMSSDCELLMMFAARAQHLEQVIVPALDSGRWVICDRFTDASFAYQGGGRGMDVEKIHTLEQMVQDGLQAHLTLLLDIDVKQGLARVALRGKADRFESELSPFFERVRLAYLDRMAADPKRFVKIDASNSLERVQHDVSEFFTRFIREQK